MIQFPTDFVFVLGMANETLLKTNLKLKGTLKSYSTEICQGSCFNKVKCGTAAKPLIFPLYLQLLQL